MNTLYVRVIDSTLEEGYPYRVDINILNHNNGVFEHNLLFGFDYYAIGSITLYLDLNSDKLCIVNPIGRIEPFGYASRTDKLEITSIMDLDKVETWKFILEHDHTADIREHLDDVMIWAVKNRYVDVMEYLFDQGFDEEGDFAIQIATGSGHLDTVKILVDRGVSDETKIDALNTAAECGHLEIVKYFVEQCGVDISSDENELYVNAAIGGHIDILEYLAEHGSNVKSDLHFAFYNAAINNRLEAMKYLYKQGVDINTIENGNEIPVGNSALEVAAEYDFTDIVKYLMELGVVACKYGDEPLKDVMSNGNIELLEAIIAQNKKNGITKIDYMDLAITHGI